LCLVDVQGIRLGSEAAVQDGPVETAGKHRQQHRDSGAQEPVGGEGHLAFQPVSSMFLRVS
jgi:hypothetical protein